MTAPGDLVRPRGVCEFKSGFHRFDRAPVQSSQSTSPTRSTTFVLLRWVAGSVSSQRARRFFSRSNTVYHHWPHEFMSFSPVQSCLRAFDLCVSHFEYHVTSTSQCVSASLLCRPASCPVSQLFGRSYMSF